MKLKIELGSSDGAAVPSFLEALGINPDGKSIQSLSIDTRQNMGGQCMGATVEFVFDISADEFNRVSSAVYEAGCKAASNNDKAGNHER